MKKTRAIEILDSCHLPYELRSFEADEFSAEEAARKLSISIEAVFKTLVAAGEKHGTVMAVVPGNCTLSLKKLAALLGDKRADMVPVEHLQRLTGYLKGGVSPLGSKKTFPVYLDQRALQQPFISVSAGLRGLQIWITPENLKRAAKATIADLCEG